MWWLILLAGGFSFVSAKFVQVTVSKDIYCQSTTICGTVSQPLSLLMDFVNEMINTIHTQGTEWTYLGQYVNPNRFQWSVFAPPAQTVVSRVARNVSQKLKFSMATTAIFFNPVNFWGAKDIAGWTTLLTKNKVFLRDTKLIETLESQLATKKYELGVGGGWYEQINNQNLMIMRNILQKYIEAGIFQPWSVINDGVSYNNITSMLTSILSAAKSFLYFDTISQFDQISRWGTDGVRIIFDSGAMSVMKTDYSCARGITNPCDSNIKKFKDTIKTLIANTKNSWSDSLETFTDAIDRLGDIFSKNPSDEFTTREEELLKSMYGSTKIGSIKKPLNFSVEETNGNILSTISGISNSFTRSWKALTDKSVPATQEKVENIQKKTLVNTMSQDVFVTIMNQYLLDVFVSQTVDQDISISSEVKDITPAFTALGIQIQAIKDDILGWKEKKNSLISSLGEACELQCGRWGKCR